MKLVLNCMKSELLVWLAAEAQKDLNDDYTVRSIVEIWINDGLNANEVYLTFVDDHYELYVSGQQIDLPLWLVKLLEKIKHVSDIKPKTLRALI